MEILREIEDFNKDYLEEKKSEGKAIKFKAPFMIADSKNKNNRRYPFEVLNTAIKKYSAKIESGKGFGADYHPQGGHVEIPDISHRITKIYMKDKIAHIEGEILPGEKGEKILSIVNSGGVLGLSARGFGEMKQGKDKVNEIQPGYQMVGVDFVVNPSENVATIDSKNIFESAPIEKTEQEKEDDLRHLYINEYLVSGGKKSFVAYRKLMEKNNEKNTFKVV